MRGVLDAKGLRIKAARSNETRHTQTNRRQCETTRGGLAGVDTPGDEEGPPDISRGGRKELDIDTLPAEVDVGRPRRSQTLPCTYMESNFWRDSFWLVPFAHRGVAG